jgi:hypothetical protein
LVLPSAAGLAVLAEPIVRLVYQRGAFDAAATVGTANMLRMYALAVFGICLHRLVVPAFYALGTPRLPTLLSIGAMLAKVPVILLLTRGLGMGAEALPLSHAITVGAECVGLVLGLRVLLAGSGLLLFHLKALAATTSLGLVAWALRDHLPVIVVVVLSGLIYLGVARAIGAWALPSLRRDPIPPFVDPDTRVLLHQIRAGGVVVDGAILRSAGRSFRAEVAENALVFRPIDEPSRAPASHLPDPEASSGLVLLIEPRPAPRLVGMEFGGQRWHINATKLIGTSGIRVPIPPLR